MLTAKLNAIGLSEAVHYESDGSTRFTCRSGESKKESDSGLRPADDGIEWPSMIIESGWSESLARLRGDVGWWLTCHEDGTRTVLLISYKRAIETLRIDRYERVQSDYIQTRSTQNRPRLIPSCTRTISIDISGDNPVVSGAPLTLPFEAIMRRQPRPNSAEGDLEFDHNDLVIWANSVAKRIRSSS
jgi:hypothetical protein